MRVRVRLGFGLGGARLGEEALVQQGEDVLLRVTVRVRVRARVRVRLRVRRVRMSLQIALSSVSTLAL